MNILMLSHAYPRFPGDLAGQFIESIAKSIAKKGHTIHLVLPEHHKLHRALIEDGVHLHIYRYAPTPAWMEWGYAQSLWADIKIKRKLYLLAPIVSLSALVTLEGVAAKHAIDIIHAHWLLPNAPIARIIALRHKLPLVISLHGSDVFLAEKNRIFRSIAQWSIRSAAAIIAPSSDLLDRASGLGASGKRLELIPYAADINWTEMKPDSSSAIRQQLELLPTDIMVLSIGRLVYKKGFCFLIEALRYTAPNVHLVLVGDGDLRAELERQTRMLRLQQRIHFIGSLSHTLIPDYLAACDIFAVPSVHDEAGNVDGLPNVALEAMAAGKPIIASQVAGLPLLINNGVNGFLVKEKNPYLLSEAIRLLAGDVNLRLRMGEVNIAKIRSELNWSNIASRYIGIYQHAIDNNCNFFPQDARR